jgi:NAD(P)-dependent dehydrogenase (short-subunit alcohol dehydrogenase family)
MPRLANKTALITGGTSGIGLAAARRFIAEGARVAVTGTKLEKIKEAQAALGPGVVGIASDSGDAAGQKAVADEVGKAFGKLDVLFINAGVGEFRPMGAWDEAAFDRSVAINLKGPFFLIQALLPYFANPASIILNGSINAHLGMPNSSLYAATKGALITLAKTLSGELVGRGIRANVISPGPISTPFYGKLGLGAAEVDQMKSGILGQIPVGRFGDPDEIAQALVYFASDESRYTVGSELIIDGGMSNL